MIAFAYAECGLTIDEFLGLSFYEWSLEIHKVRQQNKREHERWEGNAILTRELMALIANVNRDSKKRALPFEGKDFIKLSFDIASEIKEERTDEEILSKFPKTLKKNG